MKKEGNQFKKFFKEWGITILIGLGILILGLGIRLYNLTILPVFADEAIYIRWSQIMANEPTLRFLPLSDGKQPLFMWILMFLVRQFQDPLFIGRLVSVVTGLGTIIGIFGLSYFLFKKKTIALVAALFWAISPFSVFFDRMALVDSMLTMFGVWTLFLGVITAKTRRLDMAMLTGFALGAGLLTKSSAVFFALFLPTTVLGIEWPQKNKDKIVRLIKIGALFGISFLIALVMYNIQRLGPNFHLLTSRTQDYVFPLSHLWTNPKDPFIFYFHRAFQWIWIMGPGIILGFALLSLIPNCRQCWKKVVLLLSWSVLLIAIQAEFAKVFTARYILFCLPGIYILAASLFLIKQKQVRKIIFLGLGAFVIQSLWLDHFLLVDPSHASLPPGERSGYLEEWTAGTGIREAAEIIKQEHQQEPEKDILVGTEGYFGTLPDGLQMYLEGTEKVTVIGLGLGLEEVPDQLKDSVKSGTKTYLAINGSRLRIPESEFKARGMEIIASYQKAERRQDAKEYLQQGPRDTFYLFKITPQALVPRAQENQD